MRPGARRLLTALAALPPPRPLVAFGLLLLLTGGWVVWNGPGFMPDSATYSY